MTENPHINLDWHQVRPALKARGRPERHWQIKAEEEQRARELADGLEPPVGPYESPRSARDPHELGKEIPWEHLDEDLKRDVDINRAKHEQQRRNEVAAADRAAGRPRRSSRIPWHAQTRMRPGGPGGF